MTIFRICVIPVATACLVLSGLSGCSKIKDQNVLNAPWGYMRVYCSSDRITSAVCYIATLEGVKEIKQSHQSSGDMMERSRYNYTTPDGVTVKVVSFREQDEAIRVFVSIDPEDEAKLSAITRALWDRLPKD